jgi:hypothetical protein
MKKMHWQTLPAAELTQLLRLARVQDARAVGPSTVYQLELDGREVLAVSLPDGHALMVETVSLPGMNRRGKSGNPKQV